MSTIRLLALVTGGSSGIGLELAKNLAKGGAFVDNALEDEFKVIAVNITGTTHMAKRVVQHMVANGDGKSSSSRPSRPCSPPLRVRLRPVEGLRLLARRVAARGTPRHRCDRLGAAARRHR